MLTKSARPRQRFSEGLISIAVPQLPLDERAVAMELEEAIYSAAGFIQKFDDAVSLLEYCGAHITAERKAKQSNALFRDAAEYAVVWQHIAARDAPINLWNFARMLSQIRSLANGCPSIKKAANWGEGEGALAEFHRVFPDARMSRVGAAHAADILNSVQRNAIAGPYEKGCIKTSSPSLLLINNMMGNTVVATVEGEVVECEVSATTVTAMHRILRRLLGAFRGPHIGTS